MESVSLGERSRGRSEWEVQNVVNREGEGYCGKSNTSGGVKYGVPRVQVVMSL